MRRPTRTFTVELKKTSRGGVAEAPAPLSEPPPFVEPPRRPAPANPSRAAAEALFAPQPKTTPDARPERGASGAAGGGRILQSLEEQPSPFADYEPLDSEPKRRGRKPGSKNKALTPAADAIAAPVRRGRKPGSKNRPKITPAPEHWITPEAAAVAAEDAASEIIAPPPVQAQGPAAPLETLRRIGRVARSELPRAERWKARLPRFAR